MPCPCPSKKRSLFVLVAAAVGAATAISVMRSRSAKKAALPDVPTVDHVVPERYVGTWYEIARLPNWFQTKCSRNNKAEYTLTVDGMQVRNSCTRSDGSTVTTTGVAKVVPGSGNAKWRVSFLRPFYSAYWILAPVRGWRPLPRPRPARCKCWRVIWTHWRWLPVEPTLN